MSKVTEQTRIDLFFDDLSETLINLHLTHSDVWVAGSYARGEQKAAICANRIQSKSDLELLVVSNNASATRSKLKEARSDLQMVINKHFDVTRPLDFDFWVVSASRFENRPCVLFYDAVLADKRLLTGLGKTLKPVSNRYLMRDLREILIHRATNQYLFTPLITREIGAIRQAGSIVARNILDLLTVYLYSRGIFLPTYSARVSAIDDETLFCFGPSCRNIFELSLRVKLGQKEEVTEVDLRQMTDFFTSGLEELFKRTRELQNDLYKEDSMNYSGLRVLGYKASYLLKRAELSAFQAVMVRKQVLFKMLLASLKSRSRGEVIPPSHDRFLREVLLANYPYLRGKVANE